METIDFNLLTVLALPLTLQWRSSANILNQYVLKH
jgi:hypothetical protein